MKFTGSQLNPISFLLDGTSHLYDFTKSISYSIYGGDTSLDIEVIVSDPHDGTINLEFGGLYAPSGLREVKGFRVVKDYVNSLNGMAVIFDFGTGYLTNAICSYIGRDINAGTMTLIFDNLQQVKKETI